MGWVWGLRVRRKLEDKECLIQHRRPGRSEVDVGGGIGKLLCVL